MHILLVDDEKTIRKGLGFALRRKGHRVSEVESALAALELDNLSKFDLIILDLNLPFVSGREFIHILKDRGILLPVLIMTSQSVTEDEASDLSPGQVISKDLSLPEILQSIDFLLKSQISNH